jgi:hypothetical protein
LGLRENEAHTKVTRKESQWEEDHSSDRETAHDLVSLVADNVERVVNEVLRDGRKHVKRAYDISKHQQISHLELGFQA